MASGNRHADRAILQLQNKLVDGSVPTNYFNWGDKMTFSKALKFVKREYSIRLKHWSPDVTIEVMYPDDNHQMSAPYLYVWSRYGSVPWIPTMMEIFSTEWEVI